jgi:phage gp46-like protein
MPKAPAALLLCALLLAALPALAGELVLRSFVLDSRNSDVGLRFGVELDDYASLHDSLAAGVTLRLEAEARLDAKRGYWPDAPLARGALQSTLGQDPDSKAFECLLPNGEIIRDEELRPLIQNAWKNLSISLGAFSILERGNRYTLSLDVRLKQAEVPAWKRWLVFFSDFELVEGLAYQMEFQY